MNSEWVTSSLLDHYEVRSGLSKPAKDFGSGYPFLTFKDVFYNYFTPERLGDFVQSTQKEREGCSVLRGDVFLTRTSETMHELGMSCVALQDYKDATFNGFCKRLRPKPGSELLPEYVGYYFRSPKFRQAMLALSTMSTRASLNNEMIGRLEISFPHLNAQKQISRILKSLDDRITILRETNATLEAIAQALFKSWFVDFDPVRDKMEGRVPEGMDEATAALFPDGFEESELGAVPREWQTQRLDDFIELVYGKALKADCRVFGVVPVYGSGGVTGWHNKALVNAPSVIVGRKGTVGSLYWESRPFFPIDTVFYVKTKYPLTYCYYLLQTLGLKEMNTDAAVPGLNRENVYRLKVSTCPQILLSAFDAIVAPLRESIDQNLEKAETLTRLRDALLPRLISGQLRIPETEARIDALAA